MNSKQRSSARLTVLALCATLALVPTLARASRPATPDASLGNLIEYRLARHGLDRVRADVHNGVVTLTGTVDNLAERNAAEKVAKLEDISQVVDNLNLKKVDRTDAAIVVDIQDVLDHYPFYGIFDWVEAHVGDGQVELTGSVYQPWHRDVLEQRVARIEGVHSIKNEVTVQPVSLTDDAIRTQAAGALYSDFMFNDFAGTLHPPIHIVVENGKLTLEGTVRSKVEKQGAEAIVRNDTSAFHVKDDLRVSGQIPSSSRQPAT